jgi:hypothetical protein
MEDEMTDTITLSRNERAACVSVYRREHYCGMVFCPISGPLGHPGYIASPWTDEVRSRTFTTENEATDYLARDA